MGNGPESGWVKSSKKLPYPGNDPTVSPGFGFEWRGTGPIGSNRGSWYNPGTKESWYPNLNHEPPIGPHWDYSNNEEYTYRVFEDGRVELKNKRRKRNG